MELSERDRRILADLETHLTSEDSGSLRRALSGPSGVRPKWTVLPSAVVGVLLLVAGIALNVGSAVLLSLVLLGWWCAPHVPSVLRRLGGPPA